MLEYGFEQLVGLDRVRSLQQAHYKITGVCSAILDLEQNILVAEGWEDICTHFHRVHPVSYARCQESNDFGLFNRLNTKASGNGVGLSLVKRIIEEHVWVESEGEGTGSTFCFSLNCPAFKEGE